MASGTPATIEALFDGDAVEVPHCEEFKPGHTDFMAGYGAEAVVAY